MVRRIALYPTICWRDKMDARYLVQPITCIAYYRHNAHAKKYYICRASMALYVWEPLITSPFWSKDLLSSPTQESPTRLTRRGMPPTTYQESSPRRPTTDLFTRILGSSSSQSQASSQAQVSQPRRGRAGPNTLLSVCQEEEAIRWRSRSEI